MPEIGIQSIVKFRGDDACRSTTRHLPCDYLQLCRGFRALKQIVKLHYNLGDFKNMMETYR